MKEFTQYVIYDENIDDLAIVVLFFDDFYDELSIIIEHDGKTTTGPCRNSGQSLGRIEERLLGEF